VVVVLVGDAKIPSNTFGVYEVRVADNGTDALDLISCYDAGIIISREPLTITKFTKPFTILKTRSVIVGLGARKDATTDNIIQTIDMALEKVHIPLSRVQVFATTDTNRDSQSLLEAAAKLGSHLEYVTLEELHTVTSPELSPNSAATPDKIGTGGLAERTALLLAGPNAKLVLKKAKLNGVSIAIAEGD
jgi:cobalamin biosynthesis protein CbiG